ncbi:alkaline phosphatase family protein (plasmid) [Haloferacaceae archaeon DSL9]
MGLDGVGLPVLDSLFEDGVVPNIESLCNRGAVGPLKSQLPPWTPSAWPSMYTGVNPGKHGVYDFLRFDGYEWDVVNMTDVKEHAVWELLGREGYRSVVVNVPVTDPPREFDGALVPGYIAPEDPECHPPGVLSELKRALGEYRLYGEQLSSGASKAERIDGYEELISLRGRAFRHLLDEYVPSFGFLQFQQTDTVFHEFPESDEAIRRVFEAVDAEIGETLDAWDPDLVMLISDHGIGPYDGYEFRVNEFLRERGCIETAAGGAGMPSWSSLSRKRLRNGHESGDVELSSAERVLSLTAKAGLTSQRIGAVLQRLRLDGFVLDVVPMDLVRAGTERVDFRDSAAYMRSRTEMGVRINLEGREPDGIVPQAEYDSVRRELIRALQSVRSPDRTPVFDAVLPREDVFNGPYLDDAPDIVTVPRNFDQYLSASLLGEQFGPPSEPWEHKLDGMIAVSGTGVGPDADISDAHLFDLAPTILAAFGLPASDRMDGRPLPFVDRVGTKRYPEFSPQQQQQTADTDVERRLADLGYLE